ncbi:MAG: hypothetical protein NZ742_05410 [Acidobacteria bacterium]|nr:hypothetical protein [Acidobacteriota bacterium]MDW7984499.1 hypothetical protein [Acidobacteriota bacterium]
MKSRRLLSGMPVLLFLALGVLASVGPQALWSQARPSGEKEKKERELVWPPPPEKARLQWVESVFFAEDFTGESGAQRLLRKLTGEGKRRLFVYPNDVTTDDRGRIFVSDTLGSRVVVLDTHRRKIDLWTGRNPRLIGPTGLAYARKTRRLFVSDSYARRVLGFDDQGKVQLVITQKLDRPGGLAVDERREHLYVVDVQGHHIDVFDLQGSWVRTLGERGDAPGQFNFPNYIASAGLGRVPVSSSCQWACTSTTGTGSTSWTSATCASKSSSTWPPARRPRLPAGSLPRIGDLTWRMGEITRQPCLKTRGGRGVRQIREASDLSTRRPVCGATCAAGPEASYLPPIRHKNC